MQSVLKAVILCILVIPSTSHAERMELFCKVRSNGRNLDCQILGKERRVMHEEDIAQVLDSAADGVYVTERSKKGVDRVFYIDGHAPQFKHLKGLKDSGSLSKLSSARNALFGRIEKRVIKLGNELDSLTDSAELVLYDSSITLEKYKTENRDLTSELEAYRSHKEKICKSTPEYEQVSKVNSKLQDLLSKILEAYQSPESCMSQLKIVKDPDGAVDLRQLEKAPDLFKTSCAKRPKRGTASDPSM